MSRTELLRKIIQEREAVRDELPPTDKEIYDCELNSIHLQGMLEVSLLRVSEGRNTGQEVMQIIACELIYIGYQLAIEEKLGQGSSPER